MMGFGANGNGGSYSTSSSSNLSPLAPPFTVDRSVPKPVSSPLVDLTEPPYAAPLNSSPHNWVPNLSSSQVPKFLTNLPCVDGYNFERPRTIESSNTHLPPLNTVAPSAANSFSLGQCSDTVGTGFVEAKPYYPSYLSPAMHNDSPIVIPDQTTYDWSSTSNVATLDGSFLNDYSQRPSGSKYSSQWGGLWNGFNDWDQGKLQEVDGSACSKETDIPISSMYKNYTNQAHAPKSLNTCAEASHGINMLGGPVSAGKLDDKSFLGQNCNLVPIDYSRSLFESLSGFPETRRESTSIEFLPKSRNCQIPFSTTHEKKHLRQHDASPNNGTSISKSSPTPVIRPLAVGSTSLTPSPAVVKIVSLGSDSGADLCRNNSSTVKENRAPLASERKIFWDPNQLGIHLGRNNPIIWESPLTKNEEKLNSSDASNYVSKGKTGLQVSDLTPDEFNLDLNIIKTINSIEDSSETVDHHNPSVDSPCWKGASLTRFSPFEASGVAIPQQMKNQETCNILNVQAKENFPFSHDNKFSSEKPNENMIYHESGCLEHVIFPKKICSVANSVFEENTSDDTVKSSCHLETRGGKEFQHSDDTDGCGSKSIGYSDFKHSPTTQQGLEDGLASENIKGTLEHDSSHSHLPCHDVVENVYSVPVEDAAIKLDKSNGGQSTLTADVQELVDTLCSSSQLLLFRCKNGFCQLRQKDLEAVKSVINNLSMCMSNHAEKGILIPESTSSQKSISGYIGEVNEVHKGVSVDLTHLTKTAGINSQDVLDLPSDHQGNKHYVPGKKDEKRSDSIPVRDDLDMVKEEKMTQALKNVLSENFYDEEDTQPQTLLYKNLWLEAEAALCSISCKARFNRMKIEMEKSELHKSEDVYENTAVLKKLSRSEVSSNPNTVDVLSPEAEDCPTTEIQNSSFRSITCETDDLMARFRVLRCRVDNSNSSSPVNLDEPSSSKVSPDPNKAGKIPPEGQNTNGSLKSDVSIKDSTIPGTNKHTNDFEADLMDRFHILKSHVDNCSSTITEGQEVAEVVDLGYVGKRNHWPVIGPRLEDRSSDVKVEPLRQHHTANGTEGQLKVKEFHLFLDDNPLVQSHSHGSNRPGNQLLAGWHDSLSLDWEHVMKEELAGKNR